MNEYMCEVCGQYTEEDKGVTAIDGSWVCDRDSCRELDSENNAIKLN